MASGIRHYWDRIYETRQPHEVSWTQEVPKTSLDLIHRSGVAKTASIIDIGGGDGKLVDCLLDEGFDHLTVLDISEKALIRAKARLGDRASRVNWIVSDITEFRPSTTYDVWHDRATFHFLTRADQVAAYISIAKEAVKEYLIIGTFSDQGPKQCSGLETKQYNEAQLQNALADGFSRICCVTEDHVTPFNTKQHFLFCGFRRTK
jgi:hypothetical protein